MSLLGLVLLVGMAPYQDYLTSPDELTRNFMLHQAQQSRRPDVRRLDGNQIEKLRLRSTCFAIRSYIFEREDGQAPVLVGTTTCTPADTLRQKRVGRPQVGLVPLNFAPAK